MTRRELKLDRRTVMTAAAAAGGLGLMSEAASAKGGGGAARPFPDGFLWGTSTAGHQIEGNNVNSDLWLLENVPSTAYKERSGDACDSYHRFAEDIALMAAHGMNAYRFSIEWARIEPTPGYFSNAELDHYKRIIALLRKNGVLPVVTFFHVAAPRWFARLGGWLHPDSPNVFADYVDHAMKALGDGIGVACTINEPQVGLTYRIIPSSGNYFTKNDERQLAAHAEAAKATGSERFVSMDHPAIKEMTPQLMSAHAKGYSAIKANRSDLKAGVTLNLVDFAPANTQSKASELRDLAYGPWIETAARFGDFIGVQTYRQIPIPGAGDPLPQLAPMPFVEPGHLEEAIKRPEALHNMITYAHEKSGKPIIVTENGIETDNDERRKWYIPQAIGQVQKAIDEGVPVLGYMHWSLLDNFEWLQGYKPKFGLVAVNRETFERTPKPSFEVYRAIARRNGL